MNFFIFCNIIFLVYNKEYFIEGETKFTQTQRYYVPFQEHLQNSKESTFQIELFQEIRIENNTFTNISEQMRLVYLYRLNDEEDNMIMVMDNANLYCLYKIKDYLLNQQIIVTPHFCNITLPYQTCLKLVQIQQQNFILLCQFNKTQQIISLVNLEGKVFDKIQLEIQETCQMDIIYQFSYLFIFEQNCKSNNIYQVEIDEQLNEYKSIKKLEIQFKYLKNIKICSLKNIYLIYQNVIIHYDLKLNQFFERKISNDFSILDAFQLCTSSGLILNIENKSNQLKINNNTLNLTSYQYKNSLFIENIIVLNFNDCILAKINDQIQQQINISVSEIISLTDTTYFFFVHQSKLKIFQIQIPKIHHQFFQSQKILSLIFINRAYFLQKFDLEYIDIEILHKNETRLIINQQDQIIYLNSYNINDGICFQQSLLTKSLPIKLISIKQNNTYYQVNQTLKTNSCNINYQKYVKLLYYKQFNNQIIIIIMLKEIDVITYIFCKKHQIISEKTIKLMTSVKDIIMISQRTTLIYNENSIQLIRIDDQLLSINITHFPQQNKIVNVIQQFKQIGIVYENCKLQLIFIDFDQFTIMDESKSNNYNCTHYYKIQRSEILINQKEIIFKSTIQIRYQLEGTILEILTDLMSSLIVFIIQENNYITLRLYRLTKQELIQQYILPTYNYQYQPSTAQKFDNSYLMVSAKNQNKMYLLVYNLRNSAFNSLIYITEIDESQQFYQFFDLYTLVYLFNGHLFFHQINQICFRYEIQTVNNFIINNKFELFVTSQIGNQSASLNIQVLQLNHNYTLAKLNEKQNKFFIKDTLNLDLIKGNIITVDIKPIQDYQITLPLNITQKFLTCVFYQSNICFNFMSLIDIKSLNIIYTLQHELRIRKIAGIIFKQELLHYYVFYFHSNNLFQLLIQMRKNELDQLVMVNKETIKWEIHNPYEDLMEKVKIIKDVYYFQMDHYKTILFYKDICQIINLFEISETYYYFIDLEYLQDNKYLILHWSTNEIYIKVISIKSIEQISKLFCKVDIIKEYHINLLEKLDKIDFYNFDTYLKKAEIFKLKKQGNIYIFQFLMIYQSYFSVVFELSFDSINFDNLQIESYKYLRYEIYGKFLQLLYADDNFIVATFQQDNNQFVNLYDIKVEMNNKDYLDSIYRIESREYNRIEKFNASHYVIYSQNNTSLYLMTLNQFKVECLSKCTENAKLILSNDVSTITLEIQLVNTISFLNLLTIKTGILICNFIFILMNLKLSQRIKKNPV